MDITRDICVVDNVTDGFDLYRLDTGGFIRTLVVKEAERTHPKGVHFAEAGRLVIGGSDHGRVYIFDRKTAKILKTLKHAGKGGAETLAVSHSQTVILPIYDMFLIRFAIWKMVPF